MSNVQLSHSPCSRRHCCECMGGIALGPDVATRESWTCSIQQTCQVPRGGICTKVLCEHLVRCLRVMRSQATQGRQSLRFTHAEMKCIPGLFVLGGGNANYDLLRQFSMITLQPEYWTTRFLNRITPFHRSSSLEKAQAMFGSFSDSFFTTPRKVSPRAVRLAHKFRSPRIPSKTRIKLSKLNKLP